MSGQRKPAIYGRAVNGDGEHAIIPASRREEYDTSVERLIAASRPPRWRVTGDGRWGRQLWIVMDPQTRVVQMFRSWDQAIASAQRLARKGAAS